MTTPTQYLHDIRNKPSIVDRPDETTEAIHEALYDFWKEAQYEKPGIDEGISYLSDVLGFKSSTVRIAIWDLIPDGFIVLDGERCIAKVKKPKK